MKLSVVIRSKDEAPRLALTLASLARQTVTPEIVVVNDGSSDDTEAVIADAARRTSLTALHHASPHGRSGAANAGAKAANGNILLFLDGDTLAHPELVARHLAAHAEGGRRVARGETFHLRGTRFFKNPQTGEAWPDKTAQVERMSPSERARSMVTRDQVDADFAAIERRAEPGIYPGAGPRRLYDLEMDALLHHPDCDVLWAAAAGSNQSVPRRAFLDTGGFNDAIDINEHRELALRLCESGDRMAPVTGARTYHLTHRSQWRDPLRDTKWEKAFLLVNPLPAVKLLPVFWASLSFGDRIPRDIQILSLPELAAAARSREPGEIDAARRMIGEIVSESAREAAL